MASKVNIKFVIILCSVLFALFLGVAAVAYVVLQKSGADYFAQGQQFEAQGDWENAAKMYERAVGHPEGRTNPEWLNAWKNALEKTTPSTQLAYTTAFREDLSGITRQLAQIQPTNVQVQHDFLESLLSQVQLAPYTQDNYQFIVDETERVLRIFENQPEGDWQSLRRYRGIALANMLAQAASLTDAQIDGAREDLEVALRINPADGEALLGLAQWYGERAITTRGVSPERAAATFAELGQRIDQFLSENPGHPVGLLIQTRYEMTRRVGGLDPEFPLTQEMQTLQERLAPLSAELDPLFEAYRARGISTISPLDLGRLEAIELQLDQAARLRRTLALVNDMLEQDPQDPDALFVRATVLDRRSELPEAIAAYEALRDAPLRPLSAEGVRQFSMRLQATAKLSELAVRQWAAASEDEKPALLEKARQARADLASRLPEDSEILLLADARLALAEGDTREAQRLLYRYNELTSSNDPTALFLAARIAIAERATGRARTLLERVTTLQPGNLEAMLDLAAVRQSLLDVEGARQAYEGVLSIDPDNETARNGIAQLDQMAGTASPDDPVTAALMEADRILRGSATEPGNPDAAIAALTAAAESLNYDPSIAVNLARLHAGREDLDAAIAVIDRGLAAHPDHEALVRLRRALGSDDMVSELVAMAEESDRSELDKQLAIWEIYASNGMADEARRALDRAFEIAPDDPRVVDLLFNRAMSEEDYDRAAELAERAERLDLDSVGGRLFRARVQAGRGEFPEAIATLRAAISFDPVNVGARRMLARMLIGQGQTRDGLSEYAVAIQNLPNDAGLIIEYIDALRTAGDLDAALQVARDGERFARGNAPFRERWLGLEAQVGDREFARTRREAIARIDPSDRQNRIALAEVLLDLGRRSEAKALIDALREEEDTLVLAQLAARWHADARDMDSARGTFMEYIVSQDRTTIGSAPYIAMGRFLVARNEQSAGIAALQQARSFQDAEVLEADKVLADTYMGLNRYAEAVELYRGVIGANADVDNGLYRQRMTECLIRLGEFDEAERSLAALPAERRGQLTVRLLEADLARARGDRDRALRVLNETAAAHPEEPMVYMKRAQVLGTEEATRGDAMSDLDEALRVDSNNWQALRLRAALHADMGDFDAAIEDLKAAVDANPALDELRFGLIAELIRRGRGGEAEQVAMASINTRASDLDLIVTLGDLFGRQSDWARASRIYARAWEQTKILPIGRRYIESLLNQEPPDARTAQEAIAQMGDAVEREPAIRMARALAFQFQRRDDQARRDADATFDMIVSRPASFPFWLAMLEKMYGSTDAVADYLDDFERRAQSVPNSARWLSVLRGRVLIADEATRSEGEALLTRAISEFDVSPQEESAYRVLGSAYYENGQYERAADVWRGAVASYPNDAEFANNLAYTLTKHLDLAEEALPLARRALELTPDSANVMDTLGITLLELGQNEEADQVLARALPLAETPSTRLDVLLHGAQAKLALGNIEGARSLEGRARVLASEQQQVRDGYMDELDALKQQIDSRG